MAEPQLVHMTNLQQFFREAVARLLDSAFQLPHMTAEQREELIDLLVAETPGVVNDQTKGNYASPHRQVIEQRLLELFEQHGTPYKSLTSITFTGELCRQWEMLQTNKDGHWVPPGERVTYKH